MDLAPEVTAHREPGEVLSLPQADGSVMRLRKLHPGLDPTDRRAAMNHIQALHAAGEIATGLPYIDPDALDLHSALGTVAQALHTLAEAELSPGAA